MPIELPFKIQIEFVVKKDQIFIPEILKKIAEDISDITPVPDFTLYLKTVEEYTQAKEILQNYNLEVTYNIYYSKNLEITNKNINIIIPLNTHKLYKTVKKYSKQNCKIILEPTQNTPDSAFDELKLIKSDFALKNVYIQPYLTEKEIHNFSDKLMNREFLTCAAPWLSPIIDAEGNVFCCKFNKIGNIKHNSILDLWNNHLAQNIRDNLVRNKNFDTCKECLKKYTNSFIIVDNAEFEHKQNIYKFPSQINYVQSAPKIALIKTGSQHCKYNVFPYPIFGEVETIPQNIKDNILVLLE